MEGRVKFYKSGDGYGFIQGEDGQEYYFNIRAVKDLDVRIQRGAQEKFGTKGFRRQY